MRHVLLEGNPVAEFGSYIVSQLPQLQTLDGVPLRQLPQLQTLDGIARRQLPQPHDGAPRRQLPPLPPNANRAIAAGGLLYNPGSLAETLLTELTTSSRPSVQRGFFCL